MTLSELAKISAAASEAAQVFVVDSLGTPFLVKSVAVRVDSDGVSSVILYRNAMPNRVPGEEWKQHQEALAVVQRLREETPELVSRFEDFDGFYVHWEEVLCAIRRAGEGYDDYAESPLELISRLIDERDQLAIAAIKPDERNLIADAVSHRLSATPSAEHKGELEELLGKLSTTPANASEA